jgi:hypothetical protein
LGVLLGSAGVRLLAWLGAAALPREESIQVNVTVLAYTAVVAVVTGLIFGSAPVYHLVRQDLNAVFRSTGRTGTSEKRTLWTRSALVVCQVSLAFVLLIGAGLLSLSFVRLLSVNPGFVPQNLQTAEFSLPRSRCADDARLRAFMSNLVPSVRAIPGVIAAGANSDLLMAGNTNYGVIMVEGHQLGAGELPPVPYWNTVDEGYFQALGIPLRAGLRLSQGGHSRGSARGDSRRVSGEEILAEGERGGRAHPPRNGFERGAMDRGRGRGECSEHGLGGEEPAGADLLHISPVGGTADVCRGQDAGQCVGQRRGT